VIRYFEEVELVVEEMRRTRRYFMWKSAWWKERVNLRRNVPPLIADGLAAYAWKQASICDRLREKFQELWRIEVLRLKLPSNILEDSYLREEMSRNCTLPF
jgi:hypothetical protein